MRRLSLAGRLLLVAAVIGAIDISLCGLVLLGNARTATSVEVDANLGLARDYVIAALGSLMRSNNPEEAVAILPGMLYQPRHARIIVIDSRTGTVHVPGPARDRDEAAPDWFRRLLAQPEKEITLPIQVGTDTYGRVIIRSDPNDEIDEVWQDVQTLTFFGGTAYFATLLALWIVSRRTLRPLARMTAGVERLGTGDYATRIGPVEVPDLSRLASRFDDLGAALECTIAEKDELNRRLVSVADEERKAIARELHDEFGPCLFGLKVEARSILEAATRAGTAPGAEATAASARSILDITDQIQRTNQALLSQLRPMELGQLPLSRALEDLADTMSGLGPDIDWTIDIDPELDRYDETTELTIYRVAQEALTNALRHAGATRIELVARRAPGRPGLAEISVDDDGRGLAPGVSPGNGLRGMRERIASVGGRLRICPSSMGGVRVEAEVPLEPVALQEAV